MGGVRANSSQEDAGRRLHLIQEGRKEGLMNCSAGLMNDAEGMRRQC